MKKFILLFFVIFTSVNLYSQENPLISQQWFSRINHNPASVGSNDYDIFIIHRNQWYGFSNAPKSTLLNVHTSINEFNSGIGVSLAYDYEGPPRASMIAKVLYSYRINITQQSQLAFGLGLDVQNRYINYDKLVTVVPGDSELGVGKENKMSLGIDFGLEFLTKELTIGASVTNLGRKHDKLTTFLNGTQYYGYGVYRFPLSDEFDLSPTATYVFGNKEHLIEVGVTTFYKDNVWGGVAYRLDDALCFMAGFRFNVFRVGYSYDYHTNDARKFGVTHEIVLSIRIPKPQRGFIRNPDGTVTPPPNRIYQCW